jgi:hypothetical protein
VRNALLPRRHVRRGWPLHQWRRARL